MKRLKMPLTESDIIDLEAGETVMLTGYLYTARDQAHKRLVGALESDGKLPIDLKGQGIYYVGPSPTKPGEVIGSAGPTTSYRMDDLTIPLLEKGLKLMIGKGKRDEKIVDAIKKYKALYLGAIGGAGAYISNSIKEAEVIMYEDLGPEAIRKIYVEDLKLTVIIDTRGNNLLDDKPMLNIDSKRFKV